MSDSKLGQDAIGLTVEKKFGGKVYKGWVSGQDHACKMPSWDGACVAVTFPVCCYAIFLDHIYHSLTLPLLPTQVRKYFQEEELYHVTYEDDDEEDVDLRE